MDGETGDGGKRENLCLQESRSPIAYCKNILLLYNLISSSEMIASILTFLFLIFFTISLSDFGNFKLSFLISLPLPLPWPSIIHHHHHHRVPSLFLYVDITDKAERPRVGSWTSLTLAPKIQNASNFQRVAIKKFTSLMAIHMHA